MVGPKLRRYPRLHMRHLPPHNQVFTNPPVGSPGALRHSRLVPEVQQLLKHVWAEACGYPFMYLIGF